MGEANILFAKTENDTVETLFLPILDMCQNSFCLLPIFMKFIANTQETLRNILEEENCINFFADHASNIANVITITRPTICNAIFENGFIKNENSLSQ